MRVACRARLLVALRVCVAGSAVAAQEMSSEEECCGVCDGRGAGLGEWSGHCPASVTGWDSADCGDRGDEPCTRYDEVGNCRDNRPRAGEMSEEQCEEYCCACVYDAWDSGDCGDGDEKRSVCKNYFCFSSGVGLGGIIFVTIFFMPFVVRPVFHLLTPFVLYAYNVPRRRR